MTDQPTSASPSLSAPETHHPAAHAAPGTRRDALVALWPGLLLTGALAAAAFALREIPGVGIFSPMILAMVLGIAFHNGIGTPRRARAGVVFSLKRILRFAIILLGLQLTVAQLVEVGGRGLLVVVLTVGATFLFTKWFGRLIGVDRKLAELIGAGTSICGASAVIAANTVTQAHDEDVAYAVACVTLFGSLAMLIYPLLAAPFGLDGGHFGLWAGSSIHEIAQVVGATFQNSNEAGHMGTIVKLSRVLMLAPVVIAMGIAARRGADAHHRHGAKAAPPMPWFVLGFIALMGVNSAFPIPHAPLHLIAQVTNFLLSMALAAMGLETDIRKLRAKGLKSLLLAAASWLFIAGFSLALIKLIA